MLDCYSLEVAASLPVAAALPGWGHCAAFWSSLQSCFTYTQDLDVPQGSFVVQKSRDIHERVATFPLTPYCLGHPVSPDQLRGFANRTHVTAQYVWDYSEGEKESEKGV